MRWIGGVLVLLLGLELLAVLMANAWGEEAFHQLLVDTLLAHAPMALVGLLLVGFTLKLHEHVLQADEAQAHQTCRQVCKLRLMDLTDGVKGTAVGGLVDMFAGETCEAMDTGLDVLRDCRDRMRAGGLTVAGWRCVSVAKSMSEARACAPELL